MPERGRAFSGPEDGHSRLGGTGYMGKKSARQRSRVYLKLKSLSLDGTGLR